MQSTELEMDPQIYDAIFSGSKSGRRNTAFKASAISPTVAEDNKIKKIQAKMEDTNRKMNEYKILMERILLRRE